MGRATTHYYISISNAVKQQERRALGLDDNKFHYGGKQKAKEVVPGLRALRQKRAFMINQPEVVSNYRQVSLILSLFVQSAEEIEEFMDKLDRKINEERAEKKLLAN